MLNKIITFCKINFYDCDYNYIKKILFEKKGYLVIPAASSLVDIKHSSEYRIALQKASIAIFDSGYFCLCLLLKFIKVKKFSGYKFIGKLINDSEQKKKKILSLDPSINQSKKNLYFLKSKKFKFIKNYVCPIYQKNNINDVRLFQIITKYNPNIIIINIGGGVQEILAYKINHKYKYKYSIICSGAALSFYTNKGLINKTIDRIYLGWFFRLLNNPKIFINRIILSIPLILYVLFSRIKVTYK